MTNLLSTGLSYALLSADSSAKAALKPMNMVSRELEKRDPDMELVERAGKYGGMKLDQAGDALEQARKELRESQRTARQQEKQEMEERLKEKAAEKAEEKAAEKAGEKTAEKTGTKESGKAAEGEAAAESVQVSVGNRNPAGMAGTEPGAAEAETPFSVGIRDRIPGVRVDVTA